MEKLVVDIKNNNKKIEEFVLDNVPYLTKSTFYKLLRKKDIKVNGTRINKNIYLNIDDEVIVYAPNSLKEKFNNLKIVYEDENILIVNKHANMEVTGNNSLTFIVHSIYNKTDFKPMPCHRIDRNTTGLVLYAKNEETMNILLEKFKNHEIEKHYKALVYGIPKKKTDKLDAYLFKDRKKSMVYISNIPKRGYKKISTYYSVLKNYDNNTALLDIEIKTGKTHQIRAHLAYIGYPIIGDGKYGVNKVNKEFGHRYQQLSHYKMIFKFTTDSGSIEYLNNKCFMIETDEVKNG